MCYFLFFPQTFNILPFSVYLLFWLLCVKLSSPVCLVCCLFLHLYKHFLLRLGKLSPIIFLKHIFGPLRLESLPFSISVTLRFNHFNVSHSFGLSVSDFLLNIFLTYISIFFIVSSRPKIFFSLSYTLLTKFVSTVPICLDSDNLIHSFHDCGFN